MSPKIILGNYCSDDLKDVEEILCGARIIYTETGKNNERAIEFYKKHGFQITGHIPKYYQKGSDAVILVSKIS